MEGPRPDKFAFAQRSGAMKAPVGLLSDRTVLHSKMEGPRPDKFAFAQQSGATKAPVGLLSDRTVLRKQDGGASPRQVRVWCKNRACGGWVQTYKGLHQKVDSWICIRTAGTFHRRRSKCEKHGGFLMNKLLSCRCHRLHRRGGRVRQHPGTAGRAGLAALP